MSVKGLIKVVEKYADAHDVMYHNNCIFNAFMAVELEEGIENTKGYKEGSEQLLKSLNVDRKEVEFPTYEEIKKSINELVGRKMDRVVYTFKEGITVNARYLRDICKEIDATNVYVGNPNQAIKVVGKYGTAYILTVYNKSDEKIYGFSVR